MRPLILQEVNMTLQINDIAPDFEALTTEGKIKFHDWIGDSWAVLFSHPKDFTPVCTTELGYLAKIKPEFDKRGVKIIELSVDRVEEHAGWAADIEETQGFAPNYPMICDADYNVSKLYGMLPAAVSGDPAKRTPADNQTVRNDDGRPQLRRGAARHRLAPARRQAQGGNAGELEAWRRRDHRRLGHRRGREKAFSPRLEVTKAVYPDRAAAENLNPVVTTA
jgi:peroxiredoxin